ncbi:MAG: Ig-like domain-containing protein [archaeon]|nr:Ig-like domain-containing protein [archaeon]
MNFNKFFIVFVVLLVGFLLVNASTATELDDSVIVDSASSHQDISVNDINNLNIKAEDTGSDVIKLGDGGRDFTYLNGLIQNTPEGDEVSLDQDIIFVSDNDSAFKKGINVNRSITINGNCHTIDGMYIARVFNVTADNVIIKNLTILNVGGDLDGGAIYWSGVNGVLNSCTLNNCRVNDDGGAIYWSGVNGVVSDCNFIECDSYSDDGGAINFFNNGNVSGCSFINNTALTSGGAINFFNNGNVSGCSFINNSVGPWYGSRIVEGGAISFGGKGSVINCDFVNNSALFMDQHKSFGGAISFESKGSVINCSFTECNAREGGAVYFNIANSIITNSNFTNNYAYAFGGAISSQSIFVINGCNFNNNPTFSISNGTVNFGHGENLTGCINLKYHRFEEIMDTLLKGKFTATINGVDYNGTIDDNGKFIIYNADSLNIGDYTNILIKYQQFDGNGIYSVSTVNFTIEKGVPTINLSVKSSNLDVNKFVEGDDVIVIVTLPKDATGFVLISVDGGKWIKAPIVKGVAEYTFKGLKVGNHTFLVKYPGDDNYLPVATTADITITKKN